MILGKRVLRRLDNQRLNNIGMSHRVRFSYAAFCSVLIRRDAISIFACFSLDVERPLCLQFGPREIGKRRICQ